MSGQSDVQLPADSSAFDLVIFCNDDNERHYDTAYDAAKGQTLPFNKIHRVKSTGHVAADWMKLELESDWVFSINADIALDPRATVMVRSDMATEQVGCIRCSNHNELLGDKYQREVGTFDTLIFRAKALTAASRYTELRTFDMLPLLALAHYSSVAFHGKTRELQLTAPGTVQPVKSTLVTVGRNVADWTPQYTFNWCYRLGAQLRTHGKHDIGPIVKAITETAHDQWQLALTAVIYGFTAGVGPTELPSRAELASLFDRVAALADKPPAKPKAQRIKLL